MKFYKLILKEICLLIVIFAISYLIEAFIRAEFNPFLWSQVVRQSLCGSSMKLFTFGSIVIIGLEIFKEDEDDE